jgi:hypothetical protein
MFPILLYPELDSTDSIEAKLSYPNWLWGSEAFPLELFSYCLDIDCFTQIQMNDMATQLLGAKELHFFVS